MDEPVIGKPEVVQGMNKIKALLLAFETHAVIPVGTAALGMAWLVNKVPNAEYLKKVFDVSEEG